MKLLVVFGRETVEEIGPDCWIGGTVLCSGECSEMVRENVCRRGPI